MKSVVVKRPQAENHREDLQVFAHDVRQLHAYVRRAQNLAISAINPVTVESQAGPMRAFHIRVEGPPHNIRYFNRLIQDAEFPVTAP